MDQTTVGRFQGILVDTEHLTDARDVHRLGLAAGNVVQHLLLQIGVVDRVVDLGTVLPGVLDHESP